MRPPGSGEKRTAAVLNLILIDLRQRLGGGRQHRPSPGRPVHSGPPHLFDRNDFRVSARQSHRSGEVLTAGRLEIVQLTSQLAATTSNVRLEVEKAVREITTCYREMLCQAHAVIGNETEIEYLKSRWDASLDEQRILQRSSWTICSTPTTALPAPKGSMPRRWSATTVAFAKLNQATGTLVDCQQLLRKRSEYDAGRELDAARRR